MSANLSLRPLISIADSGQTYNSRPGAYALIIENNHLLAIEEPTGLFLPGGGQDPGETIIETLSRELQEEIGVSPGSSQLLLAADDCRWSPVYKQHFRIEAHYFRVALTGTAQAQEDHSRLCWLTIDQAAQSLARENDKWLLKMLTGKSEFILADSGASMENRLVCRLTWQPKARELATFNLIFGERSYQLTRLEWSANPQMELLISRVEHQFPGVPVDVI